jgi:hypothetical protein
MRSIRHAVSQSSIQPQLELEVTAQASANRPGPVQAPARAPPVANEPLQTWSQGSGFEADQSRY